MKLTDYFPVGSCKICGKPIYSPRGWIGQTKYGFTDTPKYPTCLHKEVQHDRMQKML